MNGKLRVKFSSKGLSIFNGPTFFMQQGIKNARQQYGGKFIKSADRILKNLNSAIALIEGVFILNTKVWKNGTFSNKH